MPDALSSGQSIRACEFLPLKMISSSPYLLLSQFLEHETTDFRPTGRWFLKLILKMTKDVFDNIFFICNQLLTYHNFGQIAYYFPTTVHLLLPNYIRLCRQSISSYIMECSRWFCPLAFCSLHFGVGKQGHGDMEQVILYRISVLLHQICFKWLQQTNTLQEVIPKNDFIF